ncbi:hypothetical protein LJC59_02350 [Desulfovibrio sp. OttesenSCG-928-A18]|nr:hypothetical protein [Desulfovibrio sp. OttesenSCG-928-A18]
MTDSDLRAFIINTVVTRISGKGERRDEALRAVMGLAWPQADAAALAAATIAVPELHPSLYERWAGIFADSMLESVDRRMLEDLCSGTEEGRASLLLVFSMFMESKQMEKTVARDLHALADQGRGPDTGGGAGRDMERTAGADAGQVRQS